MRDRGSIILIKNSKIALIKRIFNGKTYFVSPGGGIEHNETPHAAAERESFEELGLNVNVKNCLATIPYNGLQYFFLGEIVGGVFGKGTGNEYTSDRNRGSYQPVWMDIDTLTKLDIRPKEIAEKVQSLSREEIHFE